MSLSTRILARKNSGNPVILGTEHWTVFLLTDYILAFRAVLLVEHLEEPHVQKSSSIKKFADAFLSPFSQSFVKSFSKSVS
jgi:hypothetical protein